MSYRFLDIKASLDALKNNPDEYLSFLDAELGKELSDEGFSSLREVFEAENQTNEPGRLSGLPIVIKDNISFRNHVAGCSSKYLDNHKAHYTSPVLEKLLNEGCRVVGRANMDEFAMGSSTENSAYGPSYNPWNKKHVPGGSSGGSAAVVAAGIVPAALGSDTGGSVRQPAAFCGVVGYKPSYGVLSRYGLVAFSSSLDQIGLFTRNVPDCAQLMASMAAHDARDSTSLSEAQQQKLSWQLKDVDISQLKIGVLPSKLLQGVQPEIAQSLSQTQKWFEAQGATAVECELPYFDKGVPVYYIVALAEASSNLSRYDGIRYGHRAETESLSDIFLKSRQQGIGEEVTRRILMGTHVLSSGYYDAYYAKARKVQTLIKQDFEKAFKDIDVMLWPTTPTTAFEFDSCASPVEMYLSDIFTVCVNLAGLPAISLPTGLDDKGLPIGMHLTCAFAEDNKLLSIAAAFEKHNAFDERPNLS